MTIDQIFEIASAHLFIKKETLRSNRKHPPHVVLISRCMVWAILNQRGFTKQQILQAMGKSKKGGYQSLYIFESYHRAFYAKEEIYKRRFDEIIMQINSEDLRLKSLGIN